MEIERKFLVDLSDLPFDPKRLLGQKDRAGLSMYCPGRPYPKR